MNWKKVEKILVKTIYKSQRKFGKNSEKTKNEIRTELFLNSFVRELYMFCCIDTASVVLIFAPGLR